MNTIKNWSQFNENNTDMVTEKTLSELQKTYRAYFKEMLAIYDVDSQSKLSDELKKEFFKNIRKYWVKGKGPSKIGEELIEAIGKKEKE